MQQIRFFTGALRFHGSEFVFFGQINEPEFLSKLLYCYLTVASIKNMLMPENVWKAAKLLSRLYFLILILANHFFFICFEYFLKFVGRDRHEHQ
jgi:hypothetical protein